MGLSTPALLYLLGAIASSAGVVCVVVDVRSLIGRQREYRDRVAAAHRPDRFLSEMGDLVPKFLEEPDLTDAEQLGLVIAGLQSEVSGLQARLFEEARERAKTIEEIEAKLGKEIDAHEKSTEELIATATGVNRKPVAALVGAGLIEVGVGLATWASLLAIP